MGKTNKKPEIYFTVPPDCQSHLNAIFYVEAHTYEKKTLKMRDGGCCFISVSRVLFDFGVRICLSM